MTSTTSLIGGNLDEWRAKASFCPKEMRVVLNGGPEALGTRDEMWAILANDPLFKKDFKQKSMEEYRELNHRRWKKIVDYKIIGDPYADYERYRAFVDVMETYDQGLSARYTLHSSVSFIFVISSSFISVFLGAVSSMGTSRHEELLQKGHANEIIGCFCLTELSHGSNTQLVQTTATFDRGEFVLHTPHKGAMKVWAGNLALSATHAVVFAQLYVGGECFGMHAFVIQIRDHATHRSLQGITIGDMGEKQGQWNGVENGWMTFDHHRAPLWTLLNRGCDVTADGKYVHQFKSDRDKKSVSLGALSIGRIGIVGKGVIATRLASTIAIRYSAVRKQFGPPGGEELPILSYPLQRRRLLPILASAISINFFFDRLTGNFAEYMARVLSGEKSDELAEMSKEVHGLSSCVKPRATWIGVHALAEARAACGGHGMLFCSRLNELRDSFDPSQTFEGENNILVQQAANYILSQVKEGINTSPMGSIDFLKTRGSTFTVWQEGVIDNVECAYHWLLWHLIEKSQKAIASAKKKGLDAFTTRNVTQIDTAHVLALAYAEATMIRWAKEAVREVEDDVCRTVLMKVVSLFSVQLLQAHLGTLYIGGYCTGAEFGTRIRSAQVSLEDALCDEAVALTDAVAPPDFALHSALGSSDGKVYDHLLDEFNRHKEVRAPFTDDLISFVATQRSKSKMGKKKIFLEHQDCNMCDMLV